MRLRPSTRSSLSVYARRLVAEHDPTAAAPHTTPTLPGAGLGSDPDRDLEARLTTWTADARTDERIASRRREQWLRTAAREEATFAGVLVDLAEGGHPVALRRARGDGTRAWCVR